MVRPRTVTPPDEELHALGEEMINWVIENNPVHLTQWWRLEKHFIKDVWKNICDHPTFSPYYEEALNIIALQYLTKDSQIEPSLKHRWQRLYFKDLKDQEDDDLIAEANRKKELEAYKASLGMVSTVPAHQEQIDKDQIIMQLRYQLEQANANKPQAE